MYAHTLYIISVTIKHRLLFRYFWYFTVNNCAPRLLCLFNLNVTITFGAKKSKFDIDRVNVKRVYSTIRFVQTAEVMSAPPKRKIELTYVADKYMRNTLERERLHTLMYFV